MLKTPNLPVARKIDGYCRAGHDVYAYFNNDIGGHAVANAAQLREEPGA